MYDVIVLGCGGMGSAALYQLARRKLRVAGIEQFHLAHDRGSSHGDTRIIRKAYFMHPDYVPLLHRVYDLWREIENASGAQLFQQCGLVCAGEPEGAFIRGLQETFKKHSLPHERWSLDDLRAHYPQFTLPEDAAVYFDPAGGYLHVEECVRKQTELAIQHGADFFGDEQVLSWEVDGEGVLVKTERREVRAARLIVTTGAFAGPMLAQLGIPYQVLRKVLLWYKTPDAERFDRSRFPVWIAKFGGKDFYGFPTFASENGAGAALKAAEDSGGLELKDPYVVDRNFLPGDDENITPFMQRTFNVGHNGALRSATCLYENSADRHFIIDQYPLYPQISVATGFSGHGFKFAAVVGEILADLATEGKTRHPISLFRLSRFVEKK